MLLKLNSEPPKEDQEWCTQRLTIKRKKRPSSFYDIGDKRNQRSHEEPPTTNSSLRDFSLGKKYETKNLLTRDISGNVLIATKRPTDQSTEQTSPSSQRGTTQGISPETRLMNEDKGRLLAEARFPARCQTEVRAQLAGQNPSDKQNASGRVGSASRIAPMT